MATAEKVAHIAGVIDAVKEHISASVNLREIAVEDVRIGVFFSGVKLSTGHGGLAFCPVGEMPQAVCCPSSATRMPRAGRLLELSVEDFMGLTGSENVLLSSVGVAALNALSHLTLEARGAMDWSAVEGVDPLDLIAPSERETVGMVGAFIPYLKRLKGKVRQLHLFERNWDALRENELAYLRPSEAMPDLLPECDVVIISGAALVNRTIDEILEGSRSARAVGLVGPTASLLPGPFFDRGLTVMGGIRIYDADRMLRIISEGGSGYFLFRECAKKINFVNRPTSQRDLSCKKLERM